MNNEELIELVDKRLIPAWRELAEELRKRVPMEPKDASPYAGLSISGNGYRPLTGVVSIYCFFSASMSQINARDGASLVHQLETKLQTREQIKAARIADLRAQLAQLEGQP